MQVDGARLQVMHFIAYLKYIMDFFVPSRYFKGNIMNLTNTFLLKSQLSSDWSYRSDSWSGSNHIFIISLSADLSNILWNICPSFSGIHRLEISRSLVLSPSPVYSCVYSFPDPRPTGSLKMQKKQGGGMFNACSPLPPLGPLLLSQDTICMDRIAVAKG